MTVAVRLDSYSERGLEILVKSTGKNKSAIIREAIIRYLEDMEDITAAEESFKNMKSTKSLAEIRSQFGLDN